MRISESGSLRSGAASVATAFRAAKLYVSILFIASISASCTTIPTSGSAICDGTRAARADHAAALAETVDAVALRTGAALIAQLDAGCR